MPRHQATPIRRTPVGEGRIAFRDVEGHLSRIDLDRTAEHAVENLSCNPISHDLADSARPERIKL